MTEEESDEEGDFVIRHQLSWCSNGIVMYSLFYYESVNILALQSLKSLLDGRLKSARFIAGKFVQKDRIDGPPSSSLPPPNVPSWAIKRSFQTSPAASTNSTTRVARESIESSQDIYSDRS